MYRCNRVVCDRRHAGVHHVQHGDALYGQGEKGRSQKVAGAGAGSFEHVYVQRQIHRVSAQYFAGIVHQGDAKQRGAKRGAVRGGA